MAAVLATLKARQPKKCSKAEKAQDLLGYGQGLQGGMDSTTAKQQQAKETEVPVDYLKLEVRPMKRGEQNEGAGALNCPTRKDETGWHSVERGLCKPQTTPGPLAPEKAVRSGEHWPDRKGLRGQEEADGRQGVTASGPPSPQPRCYSETQGAEQTPPPPPAGTPQERKTREQGVRLPG